MSPVRASKFCAHSGCRTIVPGGVPRCHRHELAFQERERQRKRDYEARRPPRAVETTDPRWRVLRVAFLRQHPVCADCGGKATDAHHRIPIAVRPDLALEWTNLVALCASCHGRHTVREQVAARQVSAK